MNEEEIIRRACQGDEAAWLALVRKYQTPIFRLAYLLLGDADEAEDVAQDVLIRAYQGLARFDVTRPLRPWLLQITRNLAHNRRRAARRYLAAVTRWWQAIGDVESRFHVPLPNMQANMQREADLLWQAVRRLSEADQEVIYLRYFLELSVGETAATLGIAEGTVKSRLSRALSRLRTMVEADYPMLGKEGRS